MVEPLGEVRSAIDVTVAGPRASQVELGVGLTVGVKSLAPTSA